MPDTAVLKTPSGWIDRDNPTPTYTRRWEARAARRATRHINKIPPATLNATKSTLTIGSYSISGGVVTSQHSTLTDLQRKLYDRLVYSQGVGNNDALEVILDNGYNKAASYGHMRYAGANHSEAKHVIALDSPTLSKFYGQNRALGMNHTDALAEALLDDDSDD